MEGVFHEKQEGSLCAQHSLNALLQGSYFTAVDLAEIAKQLDESERATMAEGGLDTATYQHFIQQPSSNYDDSGFFSIQVLQEALKVWGLELLPLSHPSELARSAKREPRSQQAFICNFREHWLTVRKLGNQWFNLNSLLTGPELLSDTYLTMFLKQLETDDYSIYVVMGHFPNCEADELLRLCPAVQPIRPSLLKDAAQHEEGGNDEQMDRALRESAKILDQDDTALQQALKLSMQDTNDKGGPGTSQQSQNRSTAEPVTPSVEEVRSKRLAFLDRVSGTASGTTEPNQSRPGSMNCGKATPSQTSDSSGATKDKHPASTNASQAVHNSENELSEEEMLKKSMEMLMQQM